MFKKGFTLIELLVVIAIIGILSSIVVAGLSGAKASGRDAKRISDIKNIQLSLALYYNDNTKYPSVASANNLSTTLVNGGYISKIPTDPNGSSYFYRPFGSSVLCPGGASKYHLGAALEINKLPDDDIAGVVSGGFICSGYDPDFYGNSADCANSGGTDQCYDVTN